MSQILVVFVRFLVALSQIQELSSYINTKLASLEEKHVLNEIERDSYAFMKPRFKKEIVKLKGELSDLESKETNHTKYTQESTCYKISDSIYEAANMPNKQKLVGSIFPENLLSKTALIEPLKRTL